MIEEIRRKMAKEQKKKQPKKQKATGKCLPKNILN